MIPGEVITGDGPVIINEGRPVTVMTVANTGDRPVQVGSHFHFAQSNPALSFDREAARGMRLNIPAGTAVRFEPGLVREVSLVPLAGRRLVPGLRPEGQLTGQRLTGQESQRPTGQGGQRPTGQGEGPQKGRKEEQGKEEQDG